MDKNKVTDRNLKLLAAFHELEGSSGIETKEDLIAYIKHVGSGLSGAGGKIVKEEKKETGSKATESATSKFPRISLFYGEQGKGEVSYATWKYEINCLLQEKSYSLEQILLGIRRSVKGQASDILRRLGTGADIDVILKKFEATYGEIDNPVSILKKLYSCEQKKDELLINYAARLEEVFAEAVDLKALTPVQEKDALKCVLYQGMKQALKQLCNYKFETIDDYDKFKIECRKIESEMTLNLKSTKKNDSTTQNQAMTKQPEKDE